MQYPSIKPEVLAEKLDALLDEELPDLQADVTFVGSGAAFDSSNLDAVVARIRTALDARLASNEPQVLDDDQFEGEMAIHLHRALSSMPIEVLDDPSFWAYLAAGPLWFLVRWRENPQKRKRKPYRVYVDGRDKAACVPLRMYLRAQAVEGEVGASLTSAVPGGTDFWRSHVINVRTGTVPALTRAITEQQRDARMATAALREYAKRINRRWSNQLIVMLDEDECREIAKDERD